jgi:hypothetical protein
MEVCECAESDKKRVRLSLRAKRDVRNPNADYLNPTYTSNTASAYETAAENNGVCQNFRNSVELPCSSRMSDKRYVN